MTKPHEENLNKFPGFSHIPTGAQWLWWT
ncbi:hypothetical protein CCUS01_02554 [Colletotrichum cuscutae]|uniref:Uncharacterized protein n=1 Tax=Colletotrichum cuscutae TaxID=1209917 RepID=A0AAI9YDF0_9PEZI|nr:hypothetical protein CCUS01_02554 [Colletotrichum cuscutae]